MKNFPSIETIYKRDSTTKKLIIGEVRDETWMCVNQWVITEKVDGTNTSFVYHFDSGGKPPPAVEVRGRTANTQWQPSVLAMLQTLAPSPEQVQEVIKPRPETTVMIYGETYGAGIQKHGGLYRADKSFIGFDVRFVNVAEGQDIWLDPSHAKGVVEALGLRFVPTLAVITWLDVPCSYDDLTALTGYSEVAQVGAGNLIVPEGIVARSMKTLYDNRGNRMMWKLTFRDL